MAKGNFLDQFKKIQTWKSGGSRAPHKPLLILYAISRLQKGQNEIAYETSHEQLTDFIGTFGPPKNPRAYYPFVRLCNDGVWQLRASEVINTKVDYSNKRLSDLGVVGFFNEEIQKELVNKQNMEALIRFLLDENFPDSLHDDILNYLNLSLDDELVLGKKRARDPEFRNRIIEAYESSCAVCGYQIRKSNQLVGVEAAHIKWHQAGGPDIEQNGFALCTLHHKLYDYGLFTVDSNFILKVSSKANGAGLKEWLINFHNKEIRKPHSKKLYPEPEFIEWQVNEVFKGSYRE